MEATASTDMPEWKAYRATVEIATPPDRVFRALTDPEQLKRWQPDMIDSRPPEGGLRIGARAHATVKEYGRRFEVEFLVLALTANEYLKYELTAPQVSAQIEYRLSDLGNRTRVECEMVPRFNGFMRFMSLLLGGVFQRKLDSRLQLLRHVVETGQ